MKSRRYFLKESALAATALAIAQPLKIFAGKGSAFSFLNGNNSITLLHTNDIHNHLSPVTFGVLDGLGGFEKTLSIISEIKNKKSNVLLLDAGDIFSGNIRHEKEHTATLQMMRLAGYDAVLLGNRDYQAGTDYLHQQWQKNNTSIITSNYSYSDSRLNSLHQPYKIMYKGNIKIGIIGAGINMKGLVGADVNGKIQYINPVKVLSSIATMLKKEKKCQLVICLSHLGYKNKKAIDDITFAKQSKDIDIIIGGHSHTFMQAPCVVLNKQQEEVIINHAGYSGIALGNMTISFDDDGKKNMVNFDNLMVGTKDNKWYTKETAVSS